LNERGPKTNLQSKSTLGNDGVFIRFRPDHQPIWYQRFGGGCLFRNIEGKRKLET